MRYLVALWLWISKSIEIIKIQIEFDANSKVFKKDMNTDIEPILKEQMKLQEIQSPTKEEMEKNLMLQDKIERLTRLQKIKAQSQREIASARNVVDEIKNIALFKK